MSHHCSECRVNWSPDQTDHGRCPTCGRATVRSEEPASDDADTLHRVAHGEAAIRHIYAHIDLYYADDEDERRAA
jgi:uncharacterized Zn finger protein (UPF0148 family)